MFSGFQKSYVFQNRPLTPLRFYKQEEYNKALETQVRLLLFACVLRFKH